MTTRPVSGQPLTSHALTLAEYITRTIGRYVEQTMQPTVYVQDEAGTIFTYARLDETTLSDGSKVWNLTLSSPD